MPFHSVTNLWSFLCGSSSQWNTAWAISPKMNMLQLWCKNDKVLLSKRRDLGGGSYPGENFDVLAYIKNNF